MARTFIIPLLLFLVFSLQGHNNRIEFNSQELFLNGSNVAYVNFSRDIGTSQVDFGTFSSIFRSAAGKLNLSEFPAGIYSMNIVKGNHTEMLKVIKINIAY